MMNIHYKIVEVWPDEHLIVVRYWTDLISEESLASDDQRNDQGKPIRCRSDVAITLPIPSPQGKDLERLILKSAPRNWFFTLESVKNPNVDTNLDHISDMLGVVKVKTVELYEQNDTQYLSDEEITELVETP